MYQSIRERYLNIYKQVKRYRYNPRFYVRYANNDCTYEILINDMPAVVDFGKGNSGGTIIPVSPLILKGGEQSIVVRMYPKMMKGYNMEPFLRKGNSQLDVSVVEEEYGKEAAKAEKQLFSCEVPRPTTDHMPYAEVRGVFRAETPYTLRGWSQSQDLTKDNKEQLAKEVVTFYENYRQLMQQRDTNNIAPLLYNRELETQQAYFFDTPQDSEDLWKRFAEINAYQLQMLPLENYTLRLFGEGRVVGLTRTDNKFRGESPVIGDSPDGSYYFYPLLLHRPVPGGKLEVIR